MWCSARYKLKSSFRHLDATQAQLIVRSASQSHRLRLQRFNLPRLPLLEPFLFIHRFHLWRCCYRRLWVVFACIQFSTYLLKLLPVSGYLLEMPNKRHSEEPWMYCLKLLPLLKLSYYDHYGYANGSSHGQSSCLIMWISSGNLDSCMHRASRQCGFANACVDWNPERIVSSRPHICTAFLLYGPICGA